MPHIEFVKAIRLWSRIPDQMIDASKDKRIVNLSSLLVVLIVEI